MKITMESLITTCQFCRGQGWILSPKWAAMKTPPSQSEMAELGPEEIHCPECGGMGRVLTQAGLAVAAVVEYLDTARGIRR